MTRIGVLTRNAFRSILHARSLYLWVLAVLLVAVRLLPLVLIPNRPPRPGMNPAAQARVAEMIRNLRPNTIAGGFNEWSLFCIVFGITVAAAALSTEIASKTIITTLARPVERWELLLGKWFAIQLFALASLAVGFGVFAAAGAYFDVEFSRIVWMALAQTLVATMLYSALALAFSTIVSSTLSGALAVLVAFLPGLITFLLNDTDPLRHAIGVVLDYLVPPGYSDLYTTAVFAGSTLDYQAQATILFENLGYCLVFFVLGCVILTRREIRLG
jgi:ABC-type transport system involved in multi-copper enzyme maturation permease subunit